MTAFLSFPKDGGPHSGASVGQALAGLVARDGAGMPRAGMLAAPSVEAVAASWKVQVGRFVCVSHTNGAVQFSGLSEAEQVNITPATAIPAGQARIDRVAWDTATSQLEYVEGTAAASPTAPPLGGLAPLLRVRVDSGDGMTITGKIVVEYEVTDLVGSYPVAYTPTVSGYSAGFAPATSAQFVRRGDSVEVEVRAVTEREFSRLAGTVMVSLPFPAEGSVVSVDGGGFMLAGPAGGKRIYDVRVRNASPTQVVLELVKITNGVAERVPFTALGLSASDVFSWSVRFSYTAA